MLVIGSLEIDALEDGRNTGRPRLQGQNLETTKPNAELTVGTGSSEFVHVDTKTLTIPAKRGHLFGASYGSSAQWLPSLESVMTEALVVSTIRGAANFRIADHPGVIPR